MPTFRRPEDLRESATLVLQQTLRDIELIIVDNGSGDATPSVVAALAHADRRVTAVILDVNAGITGALNEGIRRSCGLYVQVCHDHDIYLPRMLERMADVMDRHPSVVFVHPGRQGCDHLGNPIPKARFVCGYPEVTKGTSWRRLMLSRLASPVTGLSMIRRAALEAVGLFDSEFGACSDIDMWLRLCGVGDVGYVNELLLLVRGREPGHPYSGVNWDIADQVIRAHRKHLRLCYRGLAYLGWRVRREIEIDRLLLVDFLNSMRHRRWSDVEQGRAYLRHHGVCMSRLAAWVL
jgi:glycosyltransferase involved in cell wall biosynthesis